MRNRYLRLLIKMQLYSLFGINRILHSHSKKEKRRGAALGVLAVLVLALMITYSTLISTGLAGTGAVHILPVISALISSLVTLILTFLKSSGVLVGLRDYDMVMSLPVKSSDVVWSRVMMVYLTNLLISTIVVLPAVVIFGLYAERGVWGSVIFFLSLFFLPIIPMTISLGIGVLITAVSTRSRHKNVLSLVLSTLAVLLIVSVSARAQNMSSEEILNIGLALSSIAVQLYPPAALVSYAVENQSFLHFAAFAGLSILLGCLFVGVVAHFYQRMNTAMSSHPAVKYEGKSLRVSSPLKTMYKREFDRYFSCTIYALNSTIGMVLLFVVSLLLLFIRPEIIERQSGIAGLSQMLRQVLPLVIAVFVTMTSTASASLSLEGKSRWLMCSVPVRSIDIFHSKMAVNLTVICPFVLISGLLLGIRMSVSPLQAAFLCIVPAAYACFISVLGMYMNVRFPKYDWTSEYYAVKGGAISVLVTTGTGMLSSVIPLLLCAVFQNYSSVIMFAASVLVLAVSSALYGRLRQHQLYEA